MRNKNQVAEIAGELHPDPRHHPITLYVEFKQYPMGFFLVDTKNAISLAIIQKHGTFEKFCLDTGTSLQFLEQFYSYYDDIPPDSVFETLAKSLKTSTLQIQIDTFLDIKHEFKAILNICKQHEDKNEVGTYDYTNQLFEFLIENANGKLSHQLSRLEKLNIIETFLNSISKKTA